MQTCKGVSRIAIIGAGPAGVAAAKYLLAEEAFAQIDVFEQRSTVGGVWNYTPENDRESSFTVPQTDPRAPLERPIWRADGVRGASQNGRNGHEGKHATFISPLYQRLEANLPKMIMQHGGLAFPEEEQLFPTHDAIAEYLERYADDVTQVQPVKDSGKRSWSVETQDLATEERTWKEYDAVAIASGHYTVPYVPDIDGIQQWDKRNPGIITHSKFFRRPEDFKDRKVLVIGAGYSAIDVAAQVSVLCKRPLLHSTRVNPPPASTNLQLNLPGIQSFERDRTIVFVDGSRHTDIDSVVFCTGYLYSYAFLSPSLHEDLVGSTGGRTAHTYRQIFYMPDPTLAFLALPQKIVPFPVSEAQAAALARVWAGRLDLPGKDDMLEWERRLVKEKGDGKRWHYLDVPQDGDYLNYLRAWCEDARPGAGPGKMPPAWGPKERWIRERIMPMKAAFNALGDRRHEVRTLEELGFRYEEPGESNGDGYP